MNHNKKNTRKSRKLIALFLIATLAVTCIGCSKKKTANESYDAAIKKTFSGSSSLNDLLGLDELTEKAEAGDASSYGFTINVQNLSGTVMEGMEMLAGAGLSLDAATDANNKKSHATLGLNYAGATQFSLVEHLDGTKLSLGIPELFDGSIYVDFATLAEDLKANTMMNSLLGFDLSSIPEIDTYLKAFEQALAGEVAANPLADTDIFKNLGDSLKVKSVKKSDISLPEGVSGKNFYTITLPAESLSDFLKELMELSMSMQSNETLESLTQEDLDMAMSSLSALLGDLSLNVAVNKDGYVTYMGNTFSMYGMDLFRLDMTFSGTKSPFDNFSFEFGTTMAPTTALIYEQTFDKSSGEFEIDGKLIAGGSTAMTFGTAGSFTDIEKDKKFTVDFDYIELDVPGEMSLSFGASFYLDTTKCEIPALTGPSYSFFYATEAELAALAQEAMTSLYTHPLLSELLPQMGIPEMPEFE